jgi:3-oxoacyl-[acyl-carrier-protein] synthase II
MSQRRVYIRGWGACTPMLPHGASWTETLPLLMAGQSAIRQITHFDVSGFPSRVGAWIGNDALSEVGDRRMTFAVKALDDLVARFGLPASGSDLGVFIGAESGRAAPQTVAALCKLANQDGAFSHQRFVDGTTGQHATIAALSGHAVSPAAVTSSIAARLGAGGPSHTISLACASSLAAVVTAVRQLRQGSCRHAIVGGVGADVDPFMLAGFGKLGALSVKGVSRPFDQQRDGFVVGEGAVMLWLSTEPSSDDDSLQVLGVGASLDAHHLTAPHPGGAGAEQAMRAALGEAQHVVVDYVQAHGTSTPLNDAVECKAIHRVLGDQPYRISSLKGALGHWIAGAGALGFLGAVTALRGHLLPSAGSATIDVNCPGRHIIGQGESSDAIQHALVNAFAFGGANMSVVLGRT